MFTGELTQEELNKLENASSGQEWNALCDEIRGGRRNGNWPSDWYGMVVLSGMAKRIAAKWGGDAELHVYSS